MAKDRKEHGNSSRDSDKWQELLGLIKRDVTQKAACAYVRLPVSTLHDRLQRDKKLSEQYERAEQYMDVITSNAITNAIIDKNLASNERAKISFEWKKRRDNRYREKIETRNETIHNINPLKDKLKKVMDEEK